MEYRAPNERAREKNQGTEKARSLIGGTTV
jgi:hypothetical protein